MNYLVIILAVILVVIIWYVYINFTSAPTVASNIDLSTTSLSIPGNQIKGGTSSNYAIGCWIFIKNMPSGSVDIFNYVDNKNKGTNICSLNISNTSGPTLTANIATGTSMQTQTPVILTTNLPVQTWIYAVISVSSNYIDSYLNGKLVNSTPITGPWQSTNYPTDNAQGPTFISPKSGSNDLPVIITGLSRWNTPLDPQTVWGYYSQGNGNAMQTLLGANYHLDVVFKKDSDTRDWSIF
jgi:hypothetical protein